MAAYSAADKAVQTLPASETAIQRALQAQTDTLRQELDDAKYGVSGVVCMMGVACGLALQHSYLSMQDKLASTEATVRNQTRKMKYYRGLLHDAGLMPTNPVRSHSDSSLMSPSLSLPLNVSRSCSQCSLDQRSMQASTSRPCQREEEGGILATSPSLLIARSSSSDALLQLSDIETIEVNGTDKLNMQSNDDIVGSPLGVASKLDTDIHNFERVLTETVVSQV
ncbi:hypothetical protein NP493_1208g01003 [Ridgeia piscesae]|uniref:Uncharacterized protein n=1 Tax=Ridgeia piscesae TaxID=27915 RepID=A0AAD9KCW7_RIDPI|nr:hypothetical protein NP493_1208g01003 [Ridgeia piscesae]